MDYKIKNSSLPAKKVNHITNDLAAVHFEDGTTKRYLSLDLAAQITHTQPGTIWKWARQDKEIDYVKTRKNFVDEEQIHNIGTVYKIKETCEEIGISKRTVYNYLEKGLLDLPKTPGGQQYFRESEKKKLEELVKQMHSHDSFNRFPIPDGAYNITQARHQIGCSNSFLEKLDKKPESHFKFSKTSQGRRFVLPEMLEFAKIEYERISIPEDTYTITETKRQIGCNRHFLRKLEESEEIDFTLSQTPPGRKYISPRMLEVAKKAYQQNQIPDDALLISETCNKIGCSHSFINNLDEDEGSEFQFSKTLFGKRYVSPRMYLTAQEKYQEYKEEKRKRKKAKKRQRQIRRKKKKSKKDPEEIASQLSIDRQMLDSWHEDKDIPFHYTKNGHVSSKMAKTAQTVKKNLSENPFYYQKGYPLEQIIKDPQLPLEENKGVSKREAEEIKESLEKKTLHQYKGYSKQEAASQLGLTPEEIEDLVNLKNSPLHEKQTPNGESYFLRKEIKRAKKEMKKNPFYFFNGYPIAGVAKEMHIAPDILRQLDKDPYHPFHLAQTSAGRDYVPYESLEQLSRPPNIKQLIERSIEVIDNIRRKKETNGSLDWLSFYFNKVAQGESDSSTSQKLSEIVSKSEAQTLVSILQQETPSIKGTDRITISRLMLNLKRKC